MPTGSFDFDPYPQALALDATPISVMLYDPNIYEESTENGSTPWYTLIPNVRCEQIQYKEGYEPPTARFSYVLDKTAASMNGWPDQFDDLWPLTVAPSNYIVANGDELVVLAYLSDGTTRVLFHGYARVPQTDLTAQSQHVSFVASGVAIRAWDTPIGGRIQRDADNPNTTSADFSFATDLPTRFNPAATGTQSIGGYLRNSTPSGYDVDEGGESPYPVFLDPNIDRSPDPRTFWDLSGAVRYILANWNTVYADESETDLMIDDPDFGVLDTLLQNRQPLEGQSYFDPTDPSTYTTQPNYLRDFDATNKPWPEVVATLLGFYGFGMRFVCEDDQYGRPYDYLEVYRKDAAGPTDPKEVYLPEAGSLLTEALTNVAAMHAAFDFHGVANQAFVESHPERYECSVILAPGFTPSSSDATAANLPQFTLSNLQSSNASATQRAKYRYYIADECGDGHWSIMNQTYVSAGVGIGIDFTDLFAVNNDLVDANPAGENVGLVQNDPQNFVVRYRPGLSNLFSQDILNKPLRAQLAVSRNYGSDGGVDPPCLWDTISGTWQTINGGWELMKDRLGVILTAEDPNKWTVGKPLAGTAAQEPTGVLHGVESMAAPAAAPGSGVPYTTQQFWLRLTTVIEGDYGIEATAQKRPASPIPFTIQRNVDAHDHFYYDVVDGTSPYSPSPGPAGPANATVVKDDSTQALAHACQLRTAHEFPALTASVQIPQLVGYISIGDRISQINGRDVSFLVNAGVEQGEAEAYPYVVAVTWDFEGEKQMTTIQLSDRRLEPQRV
jgi:hypothetical protein